MFTGSALFANHRSVLLHLGDVGPFFGGKETLTQLTLSNSILVSILKCFSALLGNKLWQGCRIADDASDIWIVGQLIDALTRDLDLNALSRLLDQIGSRFGLRLPPVRVFLGPSLFGDRLAFLEVLLTRLALTPDSEPLLTRSDELFGPFSHQPSAFQIGLLCFGCFRQVR